LLVGLKIEKQPLPNKLISFANPLFLKKTSDIHKTTILMMQKELYNPTQKETDLAESMMTTEERQATENREKYFEQEQPPWEPFDQENLDENFERKPVTPEQAQEMDRRLSELSEIFENSELNWHIDGALNISLLNGNYIGNHKDVDISVEKDELAKLEALLLKKGYGLFLSRTLAETKKKVMKRVGHEKFQDSDTEHMLIAAIDAKGKIRRDKSLNFVDVHVVEKNAAGQPTGSSGVALPEEWGKPYPIEFQGKPLNQSHPGKVLYYKLHQGRNYDLTDIQKLIKTGAITEKDIDDVEKVYENEFSAHTKHGRKIFEAVAEQLTPEMTPEQILEIILQQPAFKKGAEQMRGSFQPLAEKIHESAEMSADEMIRIAMELFKIEEKNNQKRKQIKKVRRSLETFNEIKQIREGFQKETLPG